MDYRELGHLTAELDPLGLVDRSKNRIRLEDYALTDSDLDSVVTAEDIAGADSRQLRDLLELLQETYCRHVGVELAHIHDAELRDWLHVDSKSRAIVWLSRSASCNARKITEARVRAVPEDEFPGSKRFSPRRRELSPDARRSSSMRARLKRSS